MNFELLSYYTD